MMEKVTEFSRALAVSWKYFNIIIAYTIYILIPCSMYDCRSTYNNNNSFRTHFKFNMLKFNTS